MKECIYCKKDYELNYFYNDKSKKDGKKPRCKNCEKKYIDKTNRRNYEKRYWNKNIDKRKLKSFRFNSKIENKIKAHEKRKKRYYDNNFILNRHINDLKRRLKNKYPIDKNYLKYLIENQLNCYYCGKELLNKYEIEHKIPVSKGGNNSNNNIVLSCMKCNRQKGNKTDIEFKKYISIVKGVGYKMV